MKDLRGVAFLVAINLIPASQAASIADQFEFLAGKEFFSTNGEKISFDNGEFAWDKNLADTEPAAITGRYLSSADTIVLQPNNSSEPLSVRIEPATGQLVLNSVTYSWGSETSKPATPAPPTDNADDLDDDLDDDLNERLGYLDGKQFTAASGSYYFEDGHFQLESPTGSLQGQYVVRDGAIRLIFDNSGQISRTIVVNIADGTVADQSNGITYSWGVKHSGSSTANPAPNPGSNVAPTPQPEIPVSPFLVSVEEQYAFLSGRGFEPPHLGSFYFYSNGGISWVDGQKNDYGKYYIKDGVIYLEFPSGGDFSGYTDQLVIPIRVFPATQSFLFNPDTSLRGFHAIEKNSPYLRPGIAISSVRGKIFRGDSGAISFPDVGDAVYLLDYSSVSDPLFIANLRNSSNYALYIAGKLNDGTPTVSSILPGKSNNKLVVNGREYIWLGESSTDYSENVAKPNLGWLMGKTFVSTQGNQLSFSSSSPSPSPSPSYALVAADGRTLDSGLIRSGTVSVYLAHLGGDNMTVRGVFPLDVKDIFPLEVDINAGSIIYKGETFSWR